MWPSGTVLQIDEGSGYGGGGDVIPLPPEYRLTVYFHLAYTGDIYGGGLTGGSSGENEMVLSGRP